MYLLRLDLHSVECTLIPRGHSKRQGRRCSPAVRTASVLQGFPRRSTHSTPPRLTPFVCGLTEATFTLDASGFAFVCWSVGSASPCAGHDVSSDPQFTVLTSAYHAPLSRHFAPCASAGLGLEPICDHGDTPYVTSEYISVNTTTCMCETYFGAS